MIDLYFSKMLLQKVWSIFSLRDYIVAHHMRIKVMLMLQYRLDGGATPLVKCTFRAAFLVKAATMMIIFEDDAATAESHVLHLQLRNW
jgi:hypothetical protein